MTDSPGHGALAYVRELEDADRALAAEAGRIHELRREVQLVRRRAESASAALERFPEGRAAAEGALREAEAELARRRAEAEEAAAELDGAERAGEAERLAAARRAVVRTRDAVTSMRARLDRARAALDDLERAAQEAQEEAPRLEERARELARRMEGLPRLSSRASAEPAAGLDGMAAWAAGADAALWVALGGAETERERVLREANELGGSVLGEALASTSVALVRERLERMRA